MIRSSLASFAALIGFFAWRFLAAMARGFTVLIRPGLRFISAILILAATIALVIDVTRWQTGAPGASFQSLEDHIRSAAPATLDGIGIFISKTLHPIVWDPILLSILAFPAWILLLLVALAFAFAARERRQVSIFIN